MKKSHIAILALILVVVAFGLTVYFSGKNKGFAEFKKFRLDEVETNLTHLSHTFAPFEIDEEKLKSLIENKSNFALSIFESSCVTSHDFDTMLGEFQESYNIDFYRIAFSDLKDTELGETIKYYPSFAIFKDGNLIDYLKADSDEHTEYYKSAESFKGWLENYIFIDEKNESAGETKETLTSPSPSEGEETPSLGEGGEQSETEGVKTETVPKQEDSKPIIDNLVYNKNKINLYLFWMNGCIYCQQEKDYLEILKKEHGNLFQINEFEISKSSKNREILNYFSNKMGDTVTGVPYTIIGNKSFMGFTESYKEEFVSTIREQYQNSYDVYFSN